MEPFKLGPLQRKWVAYLKKHPEQQMTGRLGKVVSGEKKMCCLGAGGLLVGCCEWNRGRLNELLSGSTLSLSYGYEKLGLLSNFGEIVSEAYIDLSVLNDDGEHTWVDIAYLIEAAPELFFNKSV